MMEKKNNNLIVFCDQINSQYGKMAHYIIEELIEGKIDTPSDSQVWEYYLTFALVIEYLQECGLWETSYYKDRIK